MKAPAKMTGVELLAEFCKKQHYMEFVRMAREQNSEVFEQHGGRRCWYLRRPSTPPIEVEHPTPRETVRWAAICTEINARLGPLT